MVHNYNGFVYACFPDVDTGETSEISTGTRQRKVFLFLVLALVLISWLVYPEIVSCACARVFVLLKSCSHVRNRHKRS